MTKHGVNSATHDDLNCVDIFDEWQYNINKRLLYCVGLWPYQFVFQRTVRTGFIVMVSFSLLGPQV